MKRTKTFSEIFRSYVKEGLPDKDEFLRECDAMNISRDTSRQWPNPNNKSTPVGPNRIKLSILFIRKGFEIEDFTKNPDLLKAAALLSDGHITIEDLQQVMGYQKAQPVHRIIYGEAGFLRSKASSLKEFLKKFSEEKPSLETKSLSKNIEEPGVSKSGSFLEKEDVINIAALQITALSSQFTATKRLIALIESDSFSDEDRSQLRTQVGEKEFFELTNEVFSLQRKLSSLSSRLQRESNRKLIRK